MLDKLRAVVDRYEELCARAEQPDLYADPKKAAAVMREIDIDISAHLSKQLTPNDIKNFDTIICMSKSHSDYLKALGIECEVLGDGISDPFGGDITVYLVLSHKAVGCVFKVDVTVYFAVLDDDARGFDGYVVGYFLGEKYFVI